MLSKKMKYTQEAGKSMLAVNSGEYVLLLFMCLFSATFLVATFLFLATGEEMIFLSDMQLPFLSSSFQ
ncbi:hypothetical protein H206_00660 [Candidatus Electrothrix aarhusensis]|uniref:Uncharacterized protein n=1 Tax=Candidatus Electrothrix aarhusensis TaxID=1859131 RepID=A0A3S3QEY8_9BACT|nr:hypothetical protein H206_00660 [Candidatus Electrothrix aarhusensis]